MNSVQTSSGIVYFNRYTQRLEREKVLGEASIRWVYGSALGRLSLHALIKRACFSKLLGWMKNRPSSARSIASFVQGYGINIEEAQKSLEEYTSFNDFFYRKLKAGARPLCGEGAIAFPADARHSGWQDTREMQGGYLKGQAFDLPALLGSAELAARYEGGAIVISRLCPVDYHRYHFPLAGVARASRLIPGPLASVSPYCLSRQLSWLWTNKRELTLLETPEAGQVLLMPVGATGVGSIFSSYTPDTQVEKGGEMGYFAFGGSTVITLFEPGRVQLSADLLEQTAQGYELFAKQGDIMGTL